MNPLWILCGLAIAAGAVLLVAAVRTLADRRWMGGSLQLLVATILALLGVLSGVLAVATVGYQALTREETAATVVVTRTGPRAFDARFTFPDGRSRTFPLRGDQLYVDAHIVKWHPWVNVLGVHTGYELDRVAGRYIDVEDERAGPRTIYALGRERTVDAFRVAVRYPWLEPVVDAEYGSASFVAARDSAAYVLRISTTGLLFRPAEGT